MLYTYDSLSIFFSYNCFSLDPYGWQIHNKQQNYTCVSYASHIWKNSIHFAILFLFSENNMLTLRSYKKKKRQWTLHKKYVRTFSKFDMSHRWSSIRPFSCICISISNKAWVWNTEISGSTFWDPINRFNPVTFLCLSEAKTWISIDICHGLFNNLRREVDACLVDFFLSLSLFKHFS
jgi:hypothetical protein